MTNEEVIINGVDFEETISEFELLFDEWHNKEFCTMTRIRDYAEYYKEENTKLKAEIDQLKDDSKIIAKELVAQIREIAQLKSELEQSVRLPCKVGDVVYETFRDRIQEYTIISIHLSGCSHLYGWRIKTENGVYSNVNGFEESAIGKAVFLTREEAEQSLKGQVVK